MKMLQRVFLYSFMLCSLNLFAMEDIQLNNDTCAENIRDLIDIYHLGMNKNIENTWFRSVVGALLSWYKSSFVTNEDAEKEMSKIESYIPENEHINKGYVLCKLSTDHWYVNYLMRILLYNKINQLEGVTGLTVDQVYSNNGENDVQKIVNNLAHTRFYSNFLDEKLIDIISAESLELPDIHCIILNGSDIRPSSLCMSGDSKYLRATDDHHDAIWDMQTGEKIDDPQQIIRQNILWLDGHAYADDRHKNKHVFGSYACTFEEKYRIIDQEDNYCATVRTLDADNKCKAIILCKRPQEASYICQKAFHNSYTRVDALNTLSQSAVMKAIEGFPRKNLETLIATRIKELTPTK